MCLYIAPPVQCGHRDDYGSRRQLLFVCQVDLIGANIRRTQLFRRLVEVARKKRDLLQIRHLRVECEIPHLHVFSHPLAKRCHGKTPFRDGMRCKQRFHALAKEFMLEGGQK